MLEQLVVSSGNRKESRKLRFFFLGTATLVLTGCFSVFVWSIMAMELNLTEDGLELSTLIAPVPIPAAEPPKPEPPQAQPKQQQSAKTEVSTRNQLIARPDEHQEAPQNISVTPNANKARPIGPVRITDGIESDASSTTGTVERGNGPGTGPGTPEGTVAKSDVKDDTPPPVMEKKPDEIKKPVTIVHSSIINGKATSLPKPIYPPPAIAVNAGGEVSIKVTLDEEGNVIAAHAVSGHPLLKQSALQAARNAKFSPTVLNGQKVKVTGTIIYKFSRNG